MMADGAVRLYLFSCKDREVFSEICQYVYYLSFAFAFVLQHLFFSSHGDL
jgi:hypothetical protein